VRARGVDSLGAHAEFLPGSGHNGTSISRSATLCRVRFLAPATAATALLVVHGPFGTYYRADGEHVISVNAAEVPALIALGSQLSEHAN
jgi:hypothetical protein